MAKIRKSIAIPVALLVYLVVMAVIGWQNWQAGYFGTLRYFGVMAITFGCIIMLYFSLRRRERQREQSNEQPGETDSPKE